MKDINSKKYIGIIGCGYWGKNLVRVFNELGVLKSICDNNKDVLEDKKSQYPSLSVTDNFSDILNDNEITAVVISSPASTHYNLAKMAILAKKDVFIEKPLALSVEDGEDLVNLADKNSCILMVGHILLYHSAVLKIEEILQKGQLGEIRYISSHRLNFGKLRKEENVLWSFAPHDLSAIRNFLGMPIGVRSVGKTFLSHDVPDITMSILDFGNEKSAHVFVSWLNPFKEQKMTIVGSDGMIVFDDQAENKLFLYEHNVKWDGNNYPQAVKSDPKVINISSNEPLMEEAKHFLDCIKTRKEPKSCGREALDVLKILSACQTSIENNGDYIPL